MATKGKLPLYEQFAQVVEHMVTHDGDGGHGYAQDKRYGDGTDETFKLSDGTPVTIKRGDRDCSSGVITALQAIGVDTKGATYTGDMKNALLKTGLFEWYPMSVPHYAKRGDIYLNEKHHTAVCKSDNPDMMMQFSINENGGARGGKQGDQTGSESNIRPYKNYPWDGRLCWKNRGVAAGWVKDSNGWWYRNADGTWPKSKWVKLDAWYWFSSAGYAACNCWKKINGFWYWFGTDCRMKTGWVKLKGLWYYLNPKKDGNWPEGSARTGWLTYKGKKYYLRKKTDGGTECAMVTGAFKIGDKTYKFDSSGALVS